MNAKILRAVVADDVDDGRELVTLALRRAGFEVVEARDGAELLTAVARLRSGGREIHVIIADIDMPSVDGIEATRRLRLSAPAVPVLLITGLGDERTLARASAVGARAMMRRPFDSRELVAMVRDLIEVPDSA